MIQLTSVLFGLSDGEGLGRFRPKQTGDHCSGRDEGDREELREAGQMGRDQGPASLCPSASLSL